MRTINSMLQSIYNVTTVIKVMVFRNLKKLIKPFISIKEKYFVRENKDLLLKTGFVLVLTIFCLFESFGWFYHEYISKGTSLAIGTIEHSITQYDSTGLLIDETGDVNTFIEEHDLSNTTQNSRFLKIENIGSLDLEYYITFQLDGTVSDAGILYYRIYDITDDVQASVIDPTYDTKLKAYAHNNPIPVNMEFDAVNPISNLSTINNEIQRGTIEVDGVNPDNNIKYYRIDYGVYSGINTSYYSGRSVSVHTKVYSTQTRTGEGEGAEGEIFYVENEVQFRNALLNAMSGDIIMLSNDVLIEGNINITRRIGLYANGHKLHVTGDLVYDYVEVGDLKIDVTNDGKIDVDGDLVIMAPKSKVHLLGQNTTYDVFVGGEFIVSGLQNDEEDGVLFEAIRIVKNKLGNIPADMEIMSNTRVSIAPGVVLGIVRAAPNSTNIEIINSGTLVQVQLDQMNLLNTFSKAQIYIYNLNVIQGVLGSSSIILPSNAIPYLGPNNGNTLIIRGITSSDITVEGSDNFTGEDVEQADIDNNVVPVPGEDNAYIVYITDVNHSIEGLLIDYFTENDPANITANIAAIEKLVVYTINNQYVENEDFAFLNSTRIPVLNHLNLSNSTVIDNTIINRISSNALNGKSSLKTLFLPKTLTSIGDYAFYNAQIGYISPTDAFNFVTIPASVTQIGSYAFNTAKYVKFEGTTPPEVGVGAFNNSANGVRYFVPHGSIDLYQNKVNISPEYVHYDAVLSDNKLYFVYADRHGVGISLFVSTINVGTSLTVPNRIQTRSIDYQVLSIGDNAYRHIVTDIAGTDVTLPTTVTKIGNHAFYNKNITSINVPNVTSIGNYTFYNTKIKQLIANNVLTIGDGAYENTLVEYVSLESLLTLGKDAFRNALNLYEINLGKVKNIGDYALYNCEQLGRVYFKNTDTILVHNGESIDLTVGTQALFVNWGRYLDGRLRVYVPDGESVTGLSYLEGYKRLLQNEDKIYVTGEMIGSYYHVAIPYDFGSFTVRKTTDYVLGEYTEGLEIIEYHGANLNNTYQIPETVTLSSGETLPVLSIGYGAYRHVKTSGAVDLVSPNIVNVSDYGLTNLSINSIVADNLETIGNYALSNTGITSAKFSNLYSLGNYALSNVNTLYSINLGHVMNIGEGGISNNPNLEQIFIYTTDINNMIVHSTALNNIGGSAKSRLRIYVPDGETYLNYYKTLFGYENYIYPMGYIVGSYINAPIPYDIGEYAIREVTITNSDGNPITGWEIIEYHGADFNSSYSIPSSFTANDVTMNVISIGKNAYIHTVRTVGSTFNIENENILKIDSNAFKGVAGVSVLDTLNLTFLGSNAFDGSTLTMVKAPNINTISSYALANMPSLYYVDLGTVKTMEANALYKLNNLTQVFFKPHNDTLSIDTNSISEVGSLTSNRIRFYVDRLNVLEESEIVDTLPMTSSYTVVHTTTGTGVNARHTYVLTVTVTNPNEFGVFNWRLDMSLGTNGSFVNATNANYTISASSITYYNTGSNGIIEPGESTVFTTTITTKDRYQWTPVFSNQQGDSITFEYDESLYNVTDTYSTLFKPEYQNYFYTKGEFIGSYTPMTIPLDIGVYTVIKEIYNDVDGINRMGWEIVEYHGPALTDTFIIPETLTINGLTLDVFGVGEYAFRWARMSEARTFDLISDSLLYLDNYAFYNLKGIEELELSVVERIGEYSLYGNKLYTFKTPELSELGQYALANNPTLNYLNLGPVSIIGDGALYGNTGVEQLFFTSKVVNAASSTMSISIGSNAFYNMGTQIGNRLRIYVPDGNAAAELSYVTAYKNTLPSSLSGYIFGTGYLIGSYVYGSLPYDIGEYSVREVNVINATGNSVNGWEIIEYHGEDITDAYNIPNSFTINGTTKSVVSLGSYSYYGTAVADGNSWAMSTPSTLLSIKDHAFYNTGINTISGDVLVNVGEYAFADCEFLTTVDFNSIMVIEDYAFYSNSRLTYIGLGMNVVSIGDYALYNPYYGSPTGNEGPATTLRILNTTLPSIETTSLPEIRTIMFFTYTNLTISVPQAVRTLYETTAPWSNYTITSTEYADDFLYQQINGNEIQITSYLGTVSSITIPTTLPINSVYYNVTSILPDAFDDNNYVTNITLSQYINDVGNKFLSENIDIQNIYVNASNPYFKSVNGVLFDINEEILIKYPNAKLDTTYNMPNTTKVISNHAFFGASNLSTVNMSNQLLVMATNAFNNCAGLRTVVFNTTTVPYFTAFSIFPNTVTSIKVPTGTLINYQSALYLYNYRSIITE
ncbi:MAG: leucine-rich repeat protein [Bacilli bacterium]|nr:leucine-rich repeat protein [Bacilli bacterium]MDD4808903.1 leucine-rich repeat protein [Bacilli bacterium]